MNIASLIQAWRRRWIAVRNSQHRPQRRQTAASGPLPSVKICLITSEWIGFIPVKYDPGHAVLFQAIPKEKRLFMPYDVRYQLRAGYVVHASQAQHTIQALAEQCPLLLYPDIQAWLQATPLLTKHE